MYIHVLLHAPIPTPVFGICTNTEVEYSIHEICEYYDNSCTCMYNMTIALDFCVYLRGTFTMFEQNMQRNVAQMTEHLLLLPLLHCDVLPIVYN